MRNREFEKWFEKSGIKLVGSISKGNKNWFEKSGVKLQGSISKGSENWFEKSGVKYSGANPRKTSFGSRYREEPRDRGFKKSGFYCINLILVNVQLRSLDPKSQINKVDQASVSAMRCLIQCVTSMGQRYQSVMFECETMFCERARKIQEEIEKSTGLSSKPIPSMGWYIQAI